ncbi:hypothetical protein BHE90_013695 [Fusarium euwallaceae]|uniref:Uncharacterized protein n=1 Tax=Fusarium euwallaceae TaxID=1147111 RepID=A0A430L866_9HYPO|nr:hypothetical protein BHE90_013695 [Fusarium euwallaceae]
MATSNDVAAAPPREQASRAVKIFQKQVSGEWTRKRVPNGLRAALNSRTQTQTARIFRRAGMLAFLAYHLAHTRRSSKSTLLKFVQLPVTTRKEVAERVAALDVHSSVRDFVGKLELDYPTEPTLPTSANDQGVQGMSLTTTETSRHDEPTLGPDVDRVLATLDVSHSDVHPSLSIPQQRSTDLDVSHHDGPTLDSQQQSAATRDMINAYWDSFPSSLHQSGPMTSDSSHHRVNIFPSPQRRLSLAFPQKIPGLFPEYMAGAITRDYIQTGEECMCRAAVEVMFPQDGRLDCIMSLDVKENKVEGPR